VPGIVKHAHTAREELPAEVLDRFSHALVRGILHKCHDKAQLPQRRRHIRGIVAGILQRPDVLAVGRIANDQRRTPRCCCSHGRRNSEATAVLHLCGGLCYPALPPIVE